MAHAAVIASQKRPSPFRILLWEEWRHTRGRIALLLALFILVGWSGPALAGLFALLGGPSPADAFIEVSSVLALWLGAPLAGVLLFSYYDRDDMHFAFPTRLFSLPVRTESLVLARMMYAAAITGLLYAIMGLGIAALSVEPIAVELYPLVAVSVMAYLQTLSWLTGRIPAVFVVILGTTLVYPLIWTLHSAIAILPEWLPLRSAIVLGPFCLVCYLVAVIAVAQHRHGTWINLLPLNFRRFAHTREPLVTLRSMGSFPGPGPAQRWFERTRLAPLILLCSVGVMTPLLVGQLILIATTPADFHDVPVNIDLVCFWLIFSSSIAGLLLVVFDDRDRRSGIQRYVMTRPMTTRALAFARMAGAATSVIVGFGAVLLVSMLAALIAGDLGQFWTTDVAEIPPELSVLLTLVVAWALLLIPGHLLVLYVALAAIAFTVALGLEVMDHALEITTSTEETIILATAFVASAAIVIAVAWLFRRAWRSGLLTKRDLSACLVGWLVLTGVLAFGAKSAAPHDIAWWIGIALIAPALSVAPVAVVPLTFQWYRHR